MAISKNIYLDQPRRGKTREAQVTPYKRNTVWRLSRVTVWSARWCATILLMVAVLSLSAQTVSNVTAEQVGKTIHVSYDLDKTANIALFLSIDGGKTYRELHKVTGAVGKNVLPGHNAIVWDVLAEMENLQGNNIVFKVKAVPPVTVPLVNTIVTVADITTSSASVQGYVMSDGGASVIARGFCWSTSRNPSLSAEHSTNGREIGGFSTAIYGLNPNTTYYVRAYATNSEGTGYGKEISFTTKKEDCRFVRDYDGNVYNAVLIGEQYWMKENLRTTHYADGTYIPMDGKRSSTSARRYCPDGSSHNVYTYGYLYNWRAVMRDSQSSAANPSGVQGICPAGWHVPSKAEWNQLINYVKDHYEYNKVTKALASNSGWNVANHTCNIGYNQRSNNATGFAAYPAGINSLYFGNDAFFWSSTALSSLADAYVSVLYMTYDECSAYMRGEDRGNACSVRCLRD